MRAIPLAVVAFVAGAGVGAGAIYVGSGGAAATGPASSSTPGAAPGVVRFSDSAAPANPREGLSSDDVDVRRRSVRALQTHPDRAAAADLFRLLDTETNPTIRTLAYDALAQTGDRSLVPELLRRYASETDMKMRYEALAAAANLGGPEVEAVLVGLLDTPDDSQEGVIFRGLAAEMLVRSGSPEAMAALARILEEATLPEDDDPGRTGRGFVLDELARTGGPARIALLLSVTSNKAIASDMRAEAVRAMALADGAEGTAALVKVLEDALAAPAPSKDEEDLRLAAMNALALRKGDPEAISSLTPLADGSRAVPDTLRKAAVSSLGRIGGSSSAPTLLAIAKDPKTGSTVRRAAWLAYGHAGGAEAVPDLIEAALHGPDLETKMAAARSIALAPAGPRRPALQRLAAESQDKAVAEFARTLLAKR